MMVLKGGSAQQEMKHNWGIDLWCGSSFLCFDGKELFKRKKDWAVFWVTINVHHISNWGLCTFTNIIVKNIASWTEKKQIVFVFLFLSLFEIELNLYLFCACVDLFRNVLGLYWLLSEFYLDLRLILTTLIKIWKWLLKSRFVDQVVFFFTACMKSGVFTTNWQ